MPLPHRISKQTEVEIGVCKINLNQLLYFRSAYENRNITKAAQNMHISQPALSLAIQKLETELDVPLFSRQRRGLMPTEEGTMFYEQACRILFPCENAKRLVQEVAGCKNHLTVRYVRQLWKEIYTPDPATSSAAHQAMNNLQNQSAGCFLAKSRLRFSSTYDKIQS